MHTQLVNNQITATGYKMDAIVAPLYGQYNRWVNETLDFIREASGKTHFNLGDSSILSNGTTLVSTGRSKMRRGSFDNVIFVADIDPKNSVADLVYAALYAAKVQRYQSVCLPLIRAIKIEVPPRKSLQEAVLLVPKSIADQALKASVLQTRRGIERFRSDFPDYQLDVYVSMHEVLEMAEAVGLERDIALLWHAG